MPADGRTRSSKAGVVPETAPGVSERVPAPRVSERLPAPRVSEPVPAPRYPAREQVVVGPDDPTTTPIETGEPIVEPPAREAGGVRAVVSSTRYMLRESGLKRGLRVLTAVNQQTGFD